MESVPGTEDASPAGMRYLIVLALGCSGAAATAPPPSAGPAAKAAPAPVAVPAPSDRQPDKLAGRWRVSCAENAGEVVEFAVSGDKAVGKVVTTGEAKRYGFKEGEEVFHLTLDPAGQWAGEVRYRSVSGAQHWDGVVLVAGPNGLTATVTNEACYRSFQREG
jgi:hypothetical protein